MSDCLQKGQPLARLLMLSQGARIQRQADKAEQANEENSEGCMHFGMIKVDAHDFVLTGFALYENNPT